MLLFPGMMAHAKEIRFSTNYMGLVGLNTVPTARMDKDNTVRAGVATLDPYNHAFVGMQVADPLYINLRQSMLVSSIGEKPEMVYPGMDIKLRLKEEGRYVPEVSFGMNSALGNKRFSSEYFAVSKRVYDFDLTGGIAWGRLGRAGHLPNPLARVSSHFKEERDYLSNDAATPGDWFTGADIGFFGGVEYFTPVTGLSLKADFGADNYRTERRSFDFKDGGPWSVGFNYSPTQWVSFGTSMIGTDKIMARLTFQDALSNWDGKSYKGRPPPGQKEVPGGVGWSYIPDRRIEPASTGRTRIEGHNISMVLPMNAYEPSAMQIGRAARKLTETAPADVTTVTVIPTQDYLSGKAMTFSRRDLQQAFEDKRSPEEIWNNLHFTDNDRSIAQTIGPRKRRIIPELSLSLADEETTHLYRTSVIYEEDKSLLWGFKSGSSLRFNIADNLHRLYKYRGIDEHSVRADADMFTMNKINVERTYLSWMKTVLPDFHLAVTAGYLEEMYAGYGGEVLYRPFKSPFSIGVEGWRAYKRDPMSALALNIYNDPVFTGHVNINYDIPGTDITAFTKTGKFIGGDFGMSGGLQKQFDSGLKMKAFVTATNGVDKDVFGSERNIYGGFQISLPIGSIKFVPEGSEIRANIAPIGRDDAQVVDKPVSLYEATEPMSYRHLGRNWQGVLD